MTDRPRIVPISASEPCQEVRQLLLDLADDENLTAIAFAAINRRGETRAGWAWDANVDSAKLIGGASVLTHRLIHELDP